MKLYRSLAPFLLALSILASCIGSQSCIDIAGCEINIGATGSELVGPSEPISLEHLARQLVER
jgi:hypothetical protein